MNRTSRRRVAPVAASFVAVLALGLTACSGDDDDADVDTTTTVDADAESETETETTDTDAESETETTDTDVTEPGDSTDTSGGATAEEADYVAAAAGALNLGDEEMSECVAQAIIDAIGMDRIEDSGVTPEEFVATDSLSEADLAIPADDAPALQADVEACGNLVGAFVDSGGFTEEQADCARRELTDELVAEIIVSGLAEVPGSPELEAAQAAAQECVEG